MAERLVINTGPIIALAHAKATSVVALLPIEFLAPVEVEEELARGAAAGLGTIDVSWVTFRQIRNPAPPLAVAALDLGEAAVIQLALEEGVPFVCIDERRGRRAASAVGLQVTGTLGVLGRAQKAGLVPAVRPLIAAMVAEGDWFDPALIERFLAALGE